jgi:hypothetical protein
MFRNHQFLRSLGILFGGLGILIAGITLLIWVLRTPVPSCRLSDPFPPSSQTLDRETFKQAVLQLKAVQAIFDDPEMQEFLRKQFAPVEVKTETKRQVRP